MKWSWKALMTLLMGALMLTVYIGCSDQSPLGSSESISLYRDGLDGIQTTPENQVQFDGTVETIDAGLRMLTFFARPDTVIAIENCEIFMVVAGEQTPLTFADIQIGDSMRVCGFAEQDGYIYVHRIRIFGDSECPSYDVAIRDTITGIDYAAGTFTVAGRSEIITVDENTLIWGVSTGHDLNVALKSYDENSGYNYRHRINQEHTIIYAFTDLMVGGVVEVRAWIVDSSTLYAGSIKLPNCKTMQKCVTFEAMLASVDISSRMVTFDALSWIGAVCPGAILINPDGEALNLSDFAVGDNVWVKGLPLEGDTLRICEMDLMEN